MLNRLVLLFLVFAFALPVSAQSGDIEQMLRQRDTQIKAILGTGTPSAAQRDELRDVVNDVIDFEAMAQQALGPYWTDLSAEQRTTFTDAFGGVIRAQSLADLEL